MRLAVAVGTWLGTFVLIAASSAFIAMSWDIELPYSWGFRGFPGTFAIPASVVGMLIVRRRRTHVVGWVLLASGALFGVQLFSQEYLTLSFFALREPLPGAALIGWLNVWIWMPAAMLLFAAALYIPDGRLASPRWRWVLHLWGLGVLLGIAGASADTGWIASQMFAVPPPYDPRALGVLATYAQTIFIAGFLIASVAALAGGVSVARRFGRSRGPERQQIKWFVFAAALAGLAAALNGAVMAWIGLIPYAQAAKPAQYLLILGMDLVPVSLGISILRHRLFDIDVLISRTIVYGALSALLVATYAAAVVLLQVILRPLTAGSDLAVAASTLLVVALFQPLRRRIQDAVDRRFYRSRYDAARTLDALTTRLRNEVDLDAVRHDLMSVVTETVHPAHASVWLRASRA